MGAIKTWLSRFDSPLVFWVAASILACALVTNALWLLRSRGIQRHPAWPALSQAARFVFFLGIPYLALGGWPRPPFSGLLSLEELGLVGFSPRWPATRWLQSVGTGLALGMAAMVLLLLAWTQANRAAGNHRLRFPPRQWWALWVDGLYLQVHWAFYRGALAAALEDVYTGVFVGLGLVYLEWALDPFWRQGWREPAQAAERWLRTALALVAALIFLFTRNLWVCLAIHGLLELTFWRLGQPAQTAENAESEEET